MAATVRDHATGPPAKAADPDLVISGRPIRSDSGPDFLTMALKLGAVFSLQKPFRPTDLLAAVANCLETAARRRPATTAGNIASGP